jgi:integrase
LLREKNYGIALCDFPHDLNKEVNELLKWKQAFYVWDRPKDARHRRPSDGPTLSAPCTVLQSMSTFVQDHLRPAAISAGIVLAKGQRFGLHNLRHSLSTWLVNKGKVDPKTVQGLLRHSDIRTTMNLYTQDDRDEKQAAQGAFLDALGLGSRLVQ